jgi:hypothetical protein
MNNVVDNDLDNDHAIQLNQELSFLFARDHDLALIFAQHSTAPF